MAEARAKGRILVLAVACFLGLSGPVVGQAPVQVEQRLIPPSPTGELGESDIMRAVAMIRDLGTTFAVLGQRERAAAARARWAIYQRTYHGAANRLDTMLADGQITFRDLAETQSAAVTSDGIVLDPTLAGRWQPDAVRISRRLGAGDWADVSRLAGVLVEQLAVDNSTGYWDEWSAAHDRVANVRDLVGETPGQSLQPLLVRFWHIQDKYLANALAESEGHPTGKAQFGRTAALSNEMLAVLKQVETTSGWQWRKPLETVWGERDDQARAIARTMAAPEPVEPDVAQPLPPAQVVDQAPTAVESPRSTDFDELFANPESAPQVTATGPVEDTIARADIDALHRENSARTEESRDLGARLGDLSRQVEVLAANVAEQGRQLATLTGDIAVTRTIPKALAALTESQSALERRLADLSREVGPNGLSSQLAALTAAMESAQSRSRDAEQRLEARVQARVEERLRALSREIEAAQRQASELQSRLSAFRPSAAAVEVPLQDAATRRTAFRQAVVAGVALLALLLAAIAFWVRGARQRSDDADSTDDDAIDQDAAGPDASEPGDTEGLSILMAGLHSVDQNALRDELTQLREDIESERARAGDLDQRLSRMTTQLGESQARAKRLATEMATVRADTRTVGRGLLDGAARDEAIDDELAGLRQAIEAERERARGLQTLVDELRSSVAAAKATFESNGQDMPKIALHRVAPPVIGDSTAHRRAIEALHRSDLPGFEQVFAQLTALPLPVVERIVRHSNGQDLALACRAVGIGKPHLAAILILSRRAQPGERHLAPRHLAEAMTIFDESSAKAAEQALLGWRAQAYEADGQNLGSDMGQFQ